MMVESNSGREEGFIRRWVQSRTKLGESSSIILNKLILDLHYLCDILGGNVSREREGIPIIE